MGRDIHLCFESRVLCERTETDKQEGRLCQRALQNRHTSWGPTQLMKISLLHRVRGLGRNNLWVTSVLQGSLPVVTFCGCGFCSGRRISWKKRPDGKVWLCPLTDFCSQTALFTAIYWNGFSLGLRGRDSQWMSPSLHIIKYKKRSHSLLIFNLVFSWDLCLLKDLN